MPDGGGGAVRPRLVLILSENHTLVPARDLGALVRMAVEAEAAGFDAVMVSEHVVLGPGADAGGMPENPRDYALPGNQDPSTPWPDALTLLECGRVGDVTAPAGRELDHRAAPPPAAARQAARDARPAVRGASGRPADGELAPTRVRGARGAVRAPRRAARRAPGRVEACSGATRRRRSRGATTASPTSGWSPSRSGRRARPCGSAARRCTSGSCGGWSSSAAGSTRSGRPSDEDLERLRSGMAAAGRDPAELEMVGGTRGRFEGPDGVADLGEALASIPAQLERGFTTICIKPSQFIDDPQRDRRRSAERSSNASTRS